VEKKLKRLAPVCCLSKISDKPLYVCSLGFHALSKNRCSEKVLDSFLITSANLSFCRLMSTREEEEEEEELLCKCSEVKKKKS
jgi:hypothetical protein